MAQSGGFDLPYGFKDARVVLLTQAIVGEFLQGVPIACAFSQFLCTLSDCIGLLLYPLSASWTFIPVQRHFHCWVRCSCNHAFAVPYRGSCFCTGACIVG